MKRNKTTAIPVEIITDVVPADLSPAQVTRRFRKLLSQGYELKADGQARQDPAGLLRAGYTPKYEAELFGCRFFLGNKRNTDGMKVLPAFVLPANRRGKRRIFARVFYKDSSLVWRSASHYVNTADEDWIGKGAVKRVTIAGKKRWVSAEETTDLPFELQAALDDISRRGPRARTDNRILGLVLRNGPTDRLWPYHDFSAPREKAMRDPANRINNNQPIAWFAEPGKPGSLRFQHGFEPDFARVIDSSASRSTMYGGDIRKYRIASRNGKVQYLFVSGPHHVWIVHPQAFTTELSSYGLRTVDVMADEDLCIPGYEFADNTGDEQTEDQIPAGYAGAPCPFDDDRADASPWNDRLPVIRRFRRQNLT